MDFVPVILLLIFVIVLFWGLRRVAADRQKAEALLAENKDMETFWRLAQKKSQRMFRPDIAYYDLMVRGAYVQGDLPRMAVLLAKMNRVPAPRQLDYMLGLNQFLYDAALGEFAKAKEALAYAKQTLQGNKDSQLTERLDAYEAVLAGRLNNSRAGLEVLQRRIELPSDQCPTIERAWLCYEWCCICGQQENPGLFDRYWGMYLEQLPQSFLPNLPLPEAWMQLEEGPTQ